MLPGRCNHRASAGGADRGRRGWLRAVAQVAEIDRHRARRRIDEADRNANVIDAEGDERIARVASGRQHHAQRGRHRELQSSGRHRHRRQRIGRRHAGIDANRGRRRQRMRRDDQRDRCAACKRGGHRTTGRTDLGTAGLCWSDCDGCVIGASSGCEKAKRRRTGERPDERQASMHDRFHRSPPHRERRLGTARPREQPGRRDSCRSRRRAGTPARSTGTHVRIPAALCGSVPTPSPGSSDERCSYRLSSTNRTAVVHLTTRSMAMTAIQAGESDSGYLNEGA